MLSAKQAVREWRSLYDMATAEALRQYGPTNGDTSSGTHDLRHETYLSSFREPYCLDGLRIRQERRNRRQQRGNDKLFKEILEHTRAWRGRYSYRYSKDEWETDVGRHALAAFDLAMQL